MLLALVGVSMAVGAINKFCGQAREHVAETERARVLISHSGKIEALSKNPAISDDLLSVEDTELTLVRDQVLGPLLLEPLELAIIRREGCSSARWQIAAARGVARARSRGVK
jgi:hypothetical protein